MSKAIAPWPKIATFMPRLQIATAFLITWQVLEDVFLTSGDKEW